MAYDQLDIHSINRPSGVYRIRLNFDNNVKWISTGTKASIHSQHCLMNLSTVNSSRLTEELQSALDSINIELSDHPDLVYSDGTGNIIRECFEQARANGYLVHALVAHYSNDATPVFQEFIFSGSSDPREMTIAHRRVVGSERRVETISCEFSPAKRLDVALSEIDWYQTDMSTDTRPFYLCMVGEPGDDNVAVRNRFLPQRLTDLVVDGVMHVPAGGGFPDRTFTFSAGALSHELAYGTNPFSTNPEIDKLRDEEGGAYPGVGPFPKGNWAIKLTTAIDKLFTKCNIVWDGVFPADLNFRYSHFENGSKQYQDDGLLDPSYVFLNWNYVFGRNPFQYEGGIFKGPCTFDNEMFCRDFLKAVAAQLKARIDISSYNSEGLPIARFVTFGQTFGTFPDLEQLSESSEDGLVTDKDGVRIKRRGFDGSVLCPSDSRSPVEIEIPFAPYAIGYETTPCLDASRMTPNPSLEFIDQWKCGHRGAIQPGGEAETVFPLNPDGWVVGSHLFYLSSNTSNTHFPVSHSPATNTPPGSDGDIGEVYKAGGWSAYYPVHAIYDIDRADLTNDQRKDRQKNYLISYALFFGRYLRGERRRLTIQFKGCVDPVTGLWSGIANGQTFNFKPLTTDVEYISVDIQRDILEDIITVQFEEKTVDTLPLSYRIEGDQKGAGSIGGQGSSTGGDGDAPATNDYIRDVKFYSGGVLQKTISMNVKQFHDATRDKLIAIRGTPYPYDEVGSDPYGNNSEFYFHYQGTEKGNVEIVGLSATGVKDYWASGITQVKRGANALSDVNFVLQHFTWSEDKGDFLYQRLLEAANKDRRIYVAGRFHCSRAAGVFAGFVWDAIGAGTYPLSSNECKIDTDLGILGTAATSPTLTGQANTVTIDWGSRLKPVSIMAQAWGSNAVNNAHDWQIGANPTKNQSAPVGKCTIGLWMNDWGAIVGARHLVIAAAADLDGAAQLDIFHFDFWGTLDFVSDDATTI